MNYHFKERGLFGGTQRLKKQLNNLNDTIPMQTENISLFTIQQNRIAIESVIDELGGEITPELESALKINRDQLQKKGESYIYILHQLTAYQELNKRYKEQAEANIKRAEATAERLKKNLLEAAKLFGPFTAGIHTVGTRKSTSVEITDEDAIDDIYKVTKVTTQVNKKWIGDALKSGLEVKGAELSNNLNLKIS